MRKIDDICSEIAVINPTQFNSLSFMNYLSDIEYENQIKLPEDYKAFANKFGTGEFDEGSMSFIDPFIGLDSDEAAIIRQQIKMYPNNDKKYDKWLLKLVTESIFFAIDGASNYYLWNIDTYNHIDDSYDIYCLTIEDFEDVVKIGRSFRDFLNDFCINNTKKIVGLEIEIMAFNEERIAYFRKR